MMRAHNTFDIKHGLLLPGLDGTNPLGFLAALGLLRAIDSIGDCGPVCMAWQPVHGTWVAALVGSGFDQKSLLVLLDQTLVRKIEDHPVNVLDELTTVDPPSRRAKFQRLVSKASGTARQDIDWLATLASDCVTSPANNQLQTTRRDYHRGNLTSVISDTTVEHLRRTLFVPWDYADPLDNHSLHLDPTEDRRHAHQWNSPSGDPDRKTFGGMFGANRLAIEAFPLFTSLPENDSLRTIGFSGQRSYNTRWTWPVWEVPLSVASTQSVLTLPELQVELMSTDTRNRLHHRGIVAAYRTRRILVGKTPNFTPAQRVA